MSTTPTPEKKTRKSPDRLIHKNLIVMEKGIPIPEENLPSSGKFTIPVSVMEIGESFHHPIITGQSKRQVNSIQSAIWAHGKAAPQKRFVIRVLDKEGIIRCWRVSDAKPEGSVAE